MTKKTIPGAHGQTLHLAWDGASDARPGEVFVSCQDGYQGRYVSGPALRDALLEAFPLPVEDPLADRVKAIYHKAFTTPLDPAVFKPEPKPDVVPGMVFGSRVVSGATFTVLPNDSYYGSSGQVFKDQAYSTWQSKHGYDLVLDPRDARALPSPLGIRVGDTVRRKATGSDLVTTTVEFEVNHISPEGMISAKYGMGYHLKGFEVISREVPDRLPAGTIVRAISWNGMHLITKDTAINLNNGETDNSNFARLVRDGYHEVIYLP